MSEKQSDNELEPCEYYLDPEASDLGAATHADVEVCEIDDHDLMRNVEFKQQYEQLLEPCPTGNEDEDELGWRCRRLTPPQEDGPTLCPFHRDPAEREVDDSDLARVFLAIIRDERHESPLFREFAERHVGGDSRKAEAFLRVDPPEESSEHAESVARRRKMFCGARFGQLSLPDQVFATPNRYPIDLQAATVAGVEFERAVINEPITANGLHTRPDVDGKITFKKADIDGELSLKGLVTEDKVSLSESMITDDVLLRNVCVEDEVSVRDATVGGKMDMYNAEINTTALMG